MDEPLDACTLAYDLHLWPGRVCSRKGGNAVCGDCIRDIDAPAMGFRQVDAVERAKFAMSRSLSDVGAVSPIPAPGTHHGAAHALCGPFEGATTNAV